MMFRLANSPAKGAAHIIGFCESRAGCYDSPLRLLPVELTSTIRR